MKSKHALDEVIAPAVNALGYEYVGCEYHGQGRYSVLRVYIDSPEGITVDDCANVSHQVSAILDIEDPIAGQYALEVSSPGLNRPLFNLEQCARFVGHNIQVRMRIALGGRRNFTGILTGISNNHLILELESEKHVELLFSDVEKANLVADI